MELKLFYSNTYRGAFDQLCQALSNNRAHNDCLYGKTHYVIVPDRFSLTIEKAILDKLNIQGSIDIEVVSFSRLANILLEDRIHKCLSPESSVMLLAKVIREHKNELSCYNKIQDISSFSRDMYASISEIRNNDISPEMLENTLSKIHNKGIKNKTADIVLLYKLYLKELHNRYNDNTTRLERLIEEIPNSSKIANSHIYITDFYYFKSVEYNIIKSLMRYSLSVNVALIECPDNKSLNRRIYPHYKIEEIARDLGIKVTTKRNSYKLNSINSSIERRLFSYDTLASQECGTGVELYYANDKTIELKAVAREIRQEIREGKRFRDIAIVCGDIATYAPLIESIFKKFEIPYFIDIKERINNHPLIKFLSLLLDYNLDGSIAIALELAKNYFFDMDYDKVKIFDNYCFEYKIKASELAHSFKRGEHNKDIAEQVRMKLTKIIKSAKFLSKDRVGNYIECIRKIFETFNCNQKMSKLSDIQKSNGDRRHAEITNQLPEKISDILKEMAEIIGEQEVSLDEFATMLKANLGSVSISMIPQYIDCVIIGEPLESRFAIIKSLYVIGASDNNIPYQRQDTGIITNREMNEWDMELYPNAINASYLDKLYLHQLLIKVEEKLYISYATKADDGDYLSPSIIITQLERIFKTNLESVDNIRAEDLNNEDKRLDYYAYKFSTKENAKEELINYIRHYKKGLISNIEVKPYDALHFLMDKDSKRHIKYISNLYKENVSLISSAKELFFKRDEYTSISQLQAYFICPFRHFINYGLNIKKRDEITIDILKIGSIVHYALERFVLRVLDRYKDFVGYESDIDLLIIKTIEDIEHHEEYNQILENSNYKEFVIDYIKRSIYILSKAINNSEFKPYAVEEDLEKTPLTIPHNDINIKLKGKIDRVDKYKNSIVVVDYKTGKVDDNIYKALYYGYKIQLFMYLKAYAESGCDLGGLLYMSMNNKYSKENDNTYPYRGLISDEYVNKFELRDKSILGKSINIVAKEDLKKLLDYSMNLTKKAVGEILEGYIECKPLKDQCKYCDYIDICKARLQEPSIRNISSKKIRDFI